MTAAGKITTTAITNQVHLKPGVRILVTQDPKTGALGIATRKTGAVAVLVTGHATVAGSRQSRYRLDTAAGSLTCAPSQTHWLARDKDKDALPASAFGESIRADTVTERADPERPISGRRQVHPLPLDNSAGNAERGAAEGAEWAATLAQDELRQAIDAREASVEPGPYNDAYTAALRSRLEVFDPNPRPVQASPSPYTLPPRSNWITDYHGDPGTPTTGGGTHEGEMTDQGGTPIVAGSVVDIFADGKIGPDPAGTYITRAQVVRLLPADGVLFTDRYATNGKPETVEFPHCVRVITESVGKTFEHQASTDGGKTWRTVAVGLETSDVDAYRAANEAGEGTSWRMLPESDDRARAIAAKAAELTAARRRWDSLCEWSNHGNMRTKNFGRRADANLRRAAEARRLVDRLAAELDALRRPVRAVPPLDLERLPFATHVRTDVGWYEVVRVNQKTVKVVVDPGWDDLIPIKRIKEIHERPIAAKTPAPAEVAVTVQDLPPARDAAYVSPWATV